ncbi:two-component system, CitB family, response regulator MalR [Sinobaca qinghaiensis]|uniref:Transcriptional regulatory protein n=1 Tax=Sinobaca qinghaiensis TaxID=342944 RepID=A0A419V8W6_9BACL|nr:response regulator [Sinobaca qinghaiensis]RKD76450.1 two-component system, CitB family, response regulator MalR [Sinobaca qinghaiensis]
MIQVLIIEDDPMVAKFNKIYTEKIPGFQVAAEASGVEEGWRALESHSIDLLLLDVYMAGENGIDMLVSLRKKEVPVDVIVVSSANDRASIERALRYGAADYLIKPFDFDRFKEALVRYKEKTAWMRDAPSLEQEALDHFIINRTNKNQESQPLPKGLTKITFQRIIKQIEHKNGNWFSTGELAEDTGISRVSLRKYLQYLESLEVLLIDASYEGTGRPLRQYKANPERAAFFNDPNEK